MATQVGSGLLSFPVTHFDHQLEFDEAAFRAHISWLLEYKPAALFAPGGTGEFFSLTLEEFSAVVRAAVAETAGRVPVLAGCGYGTRVAVQFAQAAERASSRTLARFRSSKTVACAHDERREESCRRDLGGPGDGARA